MNNKNDIDTRLDRMCAIYAQIPESRHGSIQAGQRPVIIVSADWLNRTSSVYTVAELTTSLKNPTMAVHYVLPPLPGLPRRSMILGEATARLIREDFISYRGSVPPEVYKDVDRAVRCGMRKKNRHKNKKHRHEANSHKKRRRSGKQKKKGG